MNITFTGNIKVYYGSALCINAYFSNIEGTMFFALYVT